MPAADRALGDRDVAMVVRRLAQIARESTLEYALRVGQLIILEFYGGDTAAWRTKGPKQASFRRLSNHPNLPMSPSALYRCVAIFEVCDRLGAVSRWPHLGASHMRCVLRLPPPDQSHLLGRANSEKWTTERLHSEVSLARSPTLRRTGRPPLAPLTKVARRLWRFIAETIATIEMPDVAERSGAPVEDLLGAIDGAIRDLERVRERLRPCGTGGASTPPPALSCDCESRRAG